MWVCSVLCLYMFLRTCFTCSLLQFLAFELKQAETTPTVSPGVGAGGVQPTAHPASVQRILALVKNAHQFGIDLVLVLRNATASDRDHLTSKT